MLRLRAACAFAAQQRSRQLRLWQSRGARLLAAALPRVVQAVRRAADAALVLRHDLQHRPQRAAALSIRGGACSSSFCLLGTEPGHLLGIGEEQGPNSRSRVAERRTEHANPDT